MDVSTLLGKCRVDSSRGVQDSVAAVIDSLNRLAAGPPATLESLVEDLIRGFRSAAESATKQTEQAAWQHLQFVASISPMVAASHQRRFGVAFDFISLGLSNSERGPQGTVEIGRFTDWLANPLISRLQLLDDLFSWGSGFWYLAWAGGTYTGTGNELKGLFIGLCTCPFWTFPDGISSVGNLAEWLIESNADLDQVQEVGAALKRALEACGTSQQGVDCAIYLQGRVGRCAGMDRTAAAALARTHPSAQIRFQVAVEDWLAGSRSTDELLEECDEARRELDRAGERTESTREVLFRVLHPVVHKLADTGAHGDLMRVLAAWNHLPGELDSPQVLIPWAQGGAMVVLPSGEVRRGAEANLRSIVESYNEFRQATLVIRGEDFEPPLPSRPGLVINNDDARCENEIGALIKDVGIVGDPAMPFSCVPLEGHPYQTVLAARSGRMSPWSVSFRAPKPDSRIGKVTILAADGMMESLEAVHVERIFASLGAEVCHVHPSDCTADAFRDAWRDPSNDVVWLSGHGDFDGLAPTRAHLVVGEDAVLFSTVRHWALPERQNRRLAVLNVCYGGAAAALEGLGGMGLATSVAGPDQAIASHLWNSHWLSSACFGVMFAQALSKQGFFEAFESACGSLRQGPSSVEPILRNCSADDLADRVQNNSSLDWGDLAVWGSPCFTQ